MNNNDCVISVFICTFINPTSALNSVYFLFPVIGNQLSKENVHFEIFFNHNIEIVCLLGNIYVTIFK